MKSSDEMQGLSEATSTGVGTYLSEGHAPFGSVAHLTGILADEG